MLKAMKIQANQIECLEKKVLSNLCLIACAGLAIIIIQSIQNFHVKTIAKIEEKSQVFICSP